MTNSGLEIPWRHVENGSCSSSLFVVKRSFLTLTSDSTGARTSQTGSSSTKEYSISKNLKLNRLVQKGIEVQYIPLYNYPNLWPRLSGSSDIPVDLGVPYFGQIMANPCPKSSMELEAMHLAATIMCTITVHQRFLLEANVIVKRVIPRVSWPVKLAHIVDELIHGDAQNWPHCGWLPMLKPKPKQNWAPQQRQWKQQRMSVERYQNQLESFRVHFQQLWTLWSSKTPRQTKSQKCHGNSELSVDLSSLSACPSLQSGCTKTPGWSGGSPGNRSTNCQLHPPGLFAEHVLLVCGLHHLEKY